MGTVVALAAQVGGAKLADGLYRLRGRDFTAVVNTGDDYEHLGLAFSPDLDTVLYTLAGIASAKPAGSPKARRRTLQCMLKALGGPERPLLGDKSLATALLRTKAWRRTPPDRDHAGFLPAPGRPGAHPADERRPCAHQRAHRRGRDPFQEYFSMLGLRPRGARPPVRRRRRARISDEVLDALHSADLEAVVICPSNPTTPSGRSWRSSGMRELLLKRGAPVIAVTPIVGGKALKGSAGKMMRELGKEPSPRAVAGEYLRLIDGFVIDKEDIALAETCARWASR